MKRIHYLLLGLLVSLTLAAVSPTLPPTRIVAGSGMTVTTNGVNNFTLAASGVPTINGAATNLYVYPASTNSFGTSFRAYDSTGTNLVFDTTGIGAVQIPNTGSLNVDGASIFTGSITSSGTNTFTGTNRFNGVVNTWRINLLWQTSNIYLSTVSGTGASYNANCVNTPTNITVSTPFETNLFTITVPALSATNSRLVFDYVVRRTNALGSIANFGIGWTVGTNFVAISSIPFATSPTFTNFLAFSSTGGGTGVEVFRNDGSMTVQQPPPAGNATVFSTPARSFVSSSLIDSTTSWTLTAKIGWSAGGVVAATNLFIDRLVIYEVIPAHY